MHLMYVKICFAEKQQLFVLKIKNERYIEEFFGYWCAALLCPLKQLKLLTLPAIVHWILFNLFLITFLTKFCNFSPNILDKWFKVHKRKRLTLVTLCTTWFPISNLPFPFLSYCDTEQTHCTVLYLSPLLFTFLHFLNVLVVWPRQFD